MIEWDNPVAKASSQPIYSIPWSVPGREGGITMG